MPHTRKRLLVTGASGFLGWNICRLASDADTVIGTSHRHATHLDSITGVSGDLTSEAFRSRLFSRYAPDAVIHTAAAADPNFCERYPDQAAAINLSATVALARRCRDAGIPFLFMSTDLIFDGTAPPYAEGDPVNPLNTYGKQKAAAERELLDVYNNATVCRMPLMYGDAPPHAKSFIHPMIAAMRSGSPLTLFTDEYRTPISATDAARGILLLLKKGCRGIFHLGGPQKLSRFEMGEFVARALGIEALLKSCRRKDVPMPALRAADVSLESTKALEKGFCPRYMEEELAKLACIRPDSKT